MLGCIHPMSSPMMKTMLGFAAPCAEAVTLAIAVAVHNMTRAIQSFLNMLMVASFNVGCRSPGRSLRPAPPSDGLPSRTGQVSILAGLGANGRMPFARGDLGRAIVDALCVFGRSRTVSRARIAAGVISKHIVVSGRGILPSMDGAALHGAPVVQTPAGAR